MAVLQSLASVRRTWGGFCGHHGRVVRKHRRLLVVLGLTLLSCDKSSGEGWRPESGHGPHATPSVSAELSKAAGAGRFEYIVRHLGGATATERLPMVIAIHGLGDRPERFGLLSTFGAPLRVVLPQGPIPHGSGYSWFSVRDLKGNGAADEIRRAAQSLAVWITEVQSRYPTTGKPLVTGFSQGGMLSFALAALHPEAIAGALPLAGWLPPKLVQAAKSSQVPCVAFHGESDRRLQFGRTASMVRRLGGPVTHLELRTYPGVGHSVSPAMAVDHQEAVLTMLAGH